MVRKQEKKSDNIDDNIDYQIECTNRCDVWGDVWIPKKIKTDFFKKPFFVGFVQPPKFAN